MFVGECMPHVHMPVGAGLPDPLQLELQAFVSAGNWTKSWPLEESMHT